MDPIETITVGNKVLKIYYDEAPPNPREWQDNLGKMVFFHRRKTMPNELKVPQDFSSWAELYEKLERDYDAKVILPVFMLDHSGVWFRAGNGFGDVDPHGWDWGQVGYIVATKKDILDNFTGWTQKDGKNIREPMKKKITKKMLEQTERVLRGEIEEYGKWANGEVYFFTVYNKCNSCGHSSDAESSVGNFYNIADMADQAPPEFRERLEKREFDRKK